MAIISEKQTNTTHLNCEIINDTIKKRLSKKFKSKFNHGYSYNQKKFTDSNFQQ